MMSKISNWKLSCLLLVSMFAISYEVFAQQSIVSDSSWNKTGISGCLLDESGQPALGATVVIQDSNAQRIEAVTDLDGNFQVMHLFPGKYTVYFTYLARHLAITDVLVEQDKICIVNERFSRKTVWIPHYPYRERYPLIDPKYPGGHQTVTREQLNRQP